MKKLILSIAVAFALTSCSTDPVAMREVNPEMGVNEVGTKIMEVTIIKGAQQRKNINNGEKKLIQFNHADNTLFINDKPYDVVASTTSTITYKDNAVSYVIDFNQGYIWEDKARTKFYIYELGKQNSYITVYTYNN